MNPRFNPLLKSSETPASARKPFQAKLVPSEKLGAPFKPLSQAMSAAPSGGGGRSRSRSDAHEHEPSIDLKREGDRITRITVVCGCGSIMEIDCEYGDAPSAPKTA